MDLMQRRQALMASVKSGRLPSAYQEVEYLQSSGNQSIKTDFAAEVNDEFETKSSSLTSGNYKTIIGAARSFELYYNIPNAAAWGSCAIVSGKTNDITTGEVCTHRLSISSNATNVTELFTYDTGYRLVGRIYYVRWYRNDLLIHEYIPCYRKSDNKPGMYDCVSNVFYTDNRGVSDFTVGPDVN